VSDKKGRSEERTDWFGDKYTQHYDKDGNKVGRSEERSDWFGDKYTQHYNKDGNKVGRSEERNDMLGDDYVQHYDEDGDKAGRSSDKTDWFGDHFEQHYNQSGEKVGHSDRRTDWFGDAYTQHYGSNPAVSRAGTRHRPPTAGAQPMGPTPQAGTNSSIGRGTRSHPSGARVPTGVLTVAVWLVGILVVSAKYDWQPRHVGPRPTLTVTCCSPVVGHWGGGITLGHVDRPLGTVFEVTRETKRIICIVDGPRLEECYNKRDLLKYTKRGKGLVWDYANTLSVPAKVFWLAGYPFVLWALASLLMWIVGARP
jgi:hypothetical protein